MLQVRRYVQADGSISISVNQAVKFVLKVTCALEESYMIALLTEQRLTLMMTIINIVENPKRSVSAPQEKWIFFKMRKILQLVCLVYLALSVVLEWYSRLKLQFYQQANTLAETMDGREPNTLLQQDSQYNPRLHHFNLHARLDLFNHPLVPLL